MSAETPPAWRIRSAVAGDEAALALVAGASFLDTYFAMVAGADMLAHLAAKASPAFFADSLVDPAIRILLAETTAGATPIGYAMLTEPDLPVAAEAGDVELRRIYALAALQGSGFGAALMRAAADAAAADGGRRLLLGTNINNLRARRFYEKQGFAVVGTRQFQVGAVTHDDLVYARPL